MKAKLAVFSFVIFGILPNQLIWAQTPYFDAIALSKLIDSNTGKFFVKPDSVASIAAILKPYLLPPPPRTDPISILNFYDVESAGNKYYNPIISDFIELGGTAGLETAKSKDLPQQVLSTISGLNVTTIAEGVAKFIVERAKAELNIAFFKGFKNKLNDPQNEDLRTLFPQTHLTLLAIDEQIYNYSLYLETLQSAFQKDFKNLFTNFANLLKIDKYQELLKEKDPILQTLLPESFVVVEMLVNGQHPSQVFEYLSQLDLLDADQSENNQRRLVNIENGFKALDLVSRSLRAKNDDNQYWVSKQEVKKLTRNANAFMLYLGLLYQQGGHIYFKTKKEIITDRDSISFRDMLGRAKNNLDSLAFFKQRMNGFANATEAIDSQLKMLTEKPQESKDQSDYFAFTNTAMEMVNQGLGFKNDFVEMDPVNANIISFSRILELLNDLSLDIKMKNYSAAIVDVVSILEIATEADSLKEYRMQLIKYGTFMAAVAKAENADQVKNALEAVALPVGSASIKKLTNFNVALSTYFGGFWGKEFLNDVNLNPKTVYGVTTPIGASVSIPANFWLCRKDIGAFSAFFSFIDLGAIAAYRADDQNTNALPEVSLKNIFAPGAYIVYGLPSVPLSIGGGYQAGPHLRKIRNPDMANMEASLDTADGYRWSFFAGVDIPLFNFYTKPK